MAHSTLSRTFFILLFLIYIINVRYFSFQLDKYLTLQSRVSNMARFAAIFEETDSERLKKAKLRLAEAQGILPFGASDMPIADVKDLKAIPSSSKVREISWRVAEPEVQYDPKAAGKKLIGQPRKWLVRNAQIFIPVALFAARVIADIVLNREEALRAKRAAELLKIISSQSPALIKAGQALASRSDLLPKEYLDALQQLQDRCPPFPTDQAFKLFQEETGSRFDEIFDESSLEPIAAASIGQVYKGVLKSTNSLVAIKIQRPNCEESIAIDIFILRWYAERLQGVLKLLRRDVDLVNVVDDFGELLYREIDYRAEAVNAQRFAELYATIPDVFVPKIYTNLSTRKVLVMEWVDGARLNDLDALKRMNLKGTKLVDILVQCSLRQMLENGFFHADPHAGNLLAMANGKLCYLDFGMVSYVEPQQRYSIIEAVVHMVNRDFVSLANLYTKMGFIPPDVDTKPIVVALENALPDVLNSAVGDFNFKNVISKLGDVMYKFPFSLPPYYIAIIRCLGVLEGLAIQVDKDFRIINDAYPYIASRLLTDSSAELQGALQQLLFTDNSINMNRLEELLEKASDINDYNINMALDQLILYIVSDKAEGIRENIAQQLIESIDSLETETSALIASNVRQNREQIISSLLYYLRNINSNVINTANIGQLIDSIYNYVYANSPPDSTLFNFAKVLKILKNSRGVSSQNITQILRKVLREPVLQELIARIVSELSERISTKMVRRVFGQPAVEESKTGSKSGGKNVRYSTS